MRARHLLVMALLLVARMATAAPLHQGLVDAQYAQMPIADELSLAILAGIPDAELVSILEEVRRRDGNHESLTTLMAMGPQAFRADAWTVIQQRKEALLAATTLIVPLNTLTFALNSVETIQGGTAYSLYKRALDDPRHPASVDKTGTLLSCSAPFHAGADRSRFCLALEGMTPRVNNPAALWLANKDLGPAFGCTTTADGKRSCQTPAGESASRSDRPIYAVVADISSRKAQFLGDRTIVRARVKHALIIDSRTGALLYRTPIALNQVPGGAPDWFWGEDAMVRLAAESRAIAKSDSPTPNSANYKRKVSEARAGALDILNVFSGWFSKL